MLKFKRFKEVTAMSLYVINTVVDLIKRTIATFKFRSY